MKWTASIAELTELVYALHASRVINKGYVDISEIASALELQFNIDLGDYYNTFSAIRRRKKEKTILLEKFKNSLIKRMEDLDD